MGMLTDDKYFNQKNKIMTMNMRFFIIAAAATLLAACTQENEVQNNPVEARITAGVSGPKTRAVDNGWNADRIGVMVVDAPGTTTTMGGKYKNVGYATTSTGTNADFTPMTAGSSSRTLSSSLLLPPTRLTHRAQTPPPCLVQTGRLR